MCSSPFRHCTIQVTPEFPCDLHVLATPPAFVLSQDQTLHLNSVDPDNGREGAVLAPAVGLPPRSLETCLQTSRPKLGLKSLKVEAGCRVVFGVTRPV